MYYIAYGSNMNLWQMSYRCPKARLVGTGILRGWRLIFNIHADIIPDDDEIVPVVIWDITDKNDWKTLDMYEGFPKYYVKKKVVANTDDGKFFTAIVYVMSQSRKGISPPYTDYFSICEQGYKDNKINIETLYDALNYSWDNMTEHNQYSLKGESADGRK